MLLVLLFFFLPVKMVIILGVGDTRAPPKKLQLETSDKCLLCFENCSKTSHEENAQALIFCRIISRYFGVDLLVPKLVTKVLCEEPETGGNADVYFQMCDKCRILGNKCVKLVQEMEVLQMKLHSVGQDLCDSMSSANERHKITRWPGTMKQDVNIMKEVRNELQTKCCLRSTFRKPVSKFLIPSAHVPIPETHAKDALVGCAVSLLIVFALALMDVDFFIDSILERKTMDAISGNLSVTWKKMRQISGLMTGRKRKQAEKKSGRTGRGLKKLCLEEQSHFSGLYSRTTATSNEINTSTSIGKLLANISTAELIGRLQDLPSMHPDTIESKVCETPSNYQHLLTEPPSNTSNHLRPTRSSLQPFSKPVKMLTKPVEPPEKPLKALQQPVTALYKPLGSPPNHFTPKPIPCPPSVASSSPPISNAQTCELCSVTFPTRGHLEKHRFVNHNLSHYVKCPKCHVRFLSYHQLESHRDGNPQCQISTEDKHFEYTQIARPLFPYDRVIQGNLFCPHDTCYEVFDSITKLNCHLSVHGVFPCNFQGICGKTFGKGHDLAVHQFESHGGIINAHGVICPRCHEVEKDKFSYVNHFVFTHLGVSPVYAGVANGHRDAHCDLDTKSAFKCGVCNVLFLKEDQYKSHMANSC